MGVSNNSDGTDRPKRKAPRSAFVPGDPRINRKGRPPLSEEQRKFREEFAKLKPLVLAAVRRGLLSKKPDSSITKTAVEKLYGQDPVNVNHLVEGELAAFLDRVERKLSKQTFAEVLAAATSEDS